MKLTAMPTLLTLSTASLLLGGCAMIDDVEPDPSAKAQLDYENVQIVMPLDEYRVTSGEEQVINHARETAIGECVQGKGFAGVEPLSSATSRNEDREYGLWNVQRAAQYGYGFAPPAAGTAPTPEGGWDSELDEAMNAARDECVASLGGILDSFTPPDPNIEPTTADNIMAEAYSLASATEEWRNARDEWKRCITAAGLTAREDDTAWSSQQAYDILLSQDPNNPSDENKREEVRVAVIEATCNKESNLAQELGDLEAGYQAALIAQEQSVLNEEKTKSRTYVDAARSYLASHQ